MKIKFNEINKKNLKIAKSLISAIEQKDAYTGDHSERVKYYSMGIGRILKLKKEDMLELEFGSLLHDVGKIGIPEELLNKTTCLSDEELNELRMHPLIGHELLKDLMFYKQSQFIVLQHHERIDGNGYPYGLRGKEIHLLAKIVCVADAFDAMTSSRAYRLEPLSFDSAINELIKYRDMQFDRDIVEALIKWTKSSGKVN